MPDDRTNLKISDETHDRGKTLKRTGESWNGLLHRAFDALESEGPNWDTLSSEDFVLAGDDVTIEHGPAPLTENHIDDIADRVAKKTATELEERLR